MFRKIASTSLASFVIGAAALAGASFATPAAAQPFDGRYERGYERPYGWRAPPPAFHGYWGHRRWQRYNDDYGYRAPPPPLWLALIANGYRWRSARRRQLTAD